LQHEIVPAVAVGQGRLAGRGRWNRLPWPRLIQWCLNPKLLAETYPPEANVQEAVMTHWHDTMVDRPETDGTVYLTGWTISGLAVLGTIVAVWVLGI